MNPGGYATWGFWIDQDGQVGEGYGCEGNGPKMSNNVSEYAAAIGAMRWFIEHGLEGKEITICSDSNLVVRQMNGQSKASTKKKGMYYDWYLKALELRKIFKRLKFQWVPREKNMKADALSRRWLDEHQIELGWRSKRKLMTRQVPC